MRWRQLTFPWCPPERRVLVSTTLRAELGHRDVQLTVEQRGSWVRLSMSAETNLPEPRENCRDDTFALELEVAGLPRCHIHEGSALHHSEYETPWALTEQPDPQIGPFGFAATWALRRLLGASQQADTWRLPRAVVALEQAFTRFGAAAVSACDPEARAVALRFHPELRFWIYQQVLQHGERVAQCARVCPGVLMLGWLLARSNDRRGVADLLERIVAGVRLRPLIAAAVHACAASGAVAVDRDLHLYRVFVRRAPAMLRPTLLAREPALGVELSDIPGGERERAIWYQAVAEMAAVHPHRELSPQHRARLTGFVSRNAVALWQDAELNNRPLTTLLAELADYASQPGHRVPSRARPVDAVLLDCSHWHVQGCLVAHLPDDMPLARCRLLPPDGPNEATQLLTVGELRVEGSTLQHCVASLAESCAEGTIFIYAATFCGERVTIAIAPRGDDLEVVEISRRRNGPPSHATRRAILDWVRQAQQAPDMQVQRSA